VGGSFFFTAVILSVWNVDHRAEITTCVIFDHCQVRAKFVPSAKFELGCQVSTWQKFAKFVLGCQVFLAWYTFHEFRL
jgi:hypothetical protein